MFLFLNLHFISSLFILHSYKSISLASKVHVAEKIWPSV